MFATAPFFYAVPTLMEYLIAGGIAFGTTAVLFVVVGIYGDDEDTPSIAIVPDQEMSRRKRPMIA